MVGSQGSTPRPGWVRAVAVPTTLEDLRGPLTGHVGLPASVFWSGPQPRAVRWDLADVHRRRDLYEIVLVEGSAHDIRTLINGVKFPDFSEKDLLGNPLSVSQYKDKLVLV